MRYLVSFVLENKMKMWITPYFYWDTVDKSR